MMEVFTGILLKNKLPATETIRYLGHICTVITVFYIDISVISDNQNYSHSRSSCHKYQFFFLVIRQRKQALTGVSLPFFRFSPLASASQ